MARFVIKDHTDLILSQLASNAMTAMEEAAKVAVEAVQEQMLYGYGTPHGPDGHTEIVDTGALFDSITGTAERKSQNLVTAEVGTDVSYAEYVYNGTHKLEGRPFIRDALMNPETQEKIKAAIVQNLPNGL